MKSICPKCDHGNPVGTLVCVECGTDIYERFVHKETRALDPKSLDILYTPVDAGTDHYADGTRLVLNMGDWGTPVYALDAGDSIVFGRGQAALAMMDLDAGWESGLSRLHAVIRRKDDNLYVEDLGSTNGTYLNHEQLERHQEAVLHDGDCVRFGLFDMRIRYLSAD